jgi:hypothetical protein
MNAPFTSEWVRVNLSKPKRGDNRPDDAGCERIAAALNYAYDRANFGETVDSVHIFARTPVGHPSTKSAAAARGRRWARLLPAGTVVCAELNAVNPGRKPPFAYSKDGAVVKLLHQAIPLITGEHPTTGNIETAFRRI